MKEAANLLQRFLPWLLCVVLCWMLTSVFAPSSGPPEQLQQAEIYHNKRDYSRAAAIYKDIIEHHSNTVHALKAHKGLTMLLIDSSDYSGAEAAIEDMIKAAPSDPNLPKAIYEIARKYEAARKRQDAQGLYDPNDEYPLWARGRMVVLGIEFADAQRAQQAMDDLIADSRVHPNVNRLFSDIAGHRPATYRTRRTEYYEQLDGGPGVYTGSSGGPARNHAEAQLLYEYVIEQHPRTLYALHALKNLASRNIAGVRNHPEAIVISKAGGRSVYLLNEERLQKAAECVDNLCQDFSGHRDFPAAIFHLAERYRWSLDQRPELAERLYRRLIDKYKHTEYHIKAWKSLVLLYLDTGEELRGTETLQELLRDNANDPDLPRLLYDIAFHLETEERDKPDRAEPLYQYLVRQYPKTRYAILARGRLLGIRIKSGDDKALLPGLDQLLNDFEKDKATPKAILDVARSFAYASNHTGEIEVLEFFCEQFPDSPDMCHAIYRIGYAYRLLREYETAAKYYKRVFNDYPRSTYARHLPKSIGRLYKSAGDAEQAIYWFDRQSEQSGYELGADRALFDKYTVYRDLLKDYDKAIDIIREYQAKFPAGEKAHIIPYSLGELVSHDPTITEKAIAVLEEGLAACQDPEIADKYRKKLEELRANHD